MSFAFISCKQSYRVGDFTVVVEANKYQSLGGALKTDSYDVFFKGKEINWIKHFDADKVPEIWNFRRLEFDASYLLVEANEGYYLLKPSGDDAQVEYVSEASHRAGAFVSKPYTELLNKDLLFHQPGVLVNLQTLKKDTSGVNLGGRLLAASEDYSNIVYVDGVFDENIKETFDKLNRAAQSHSVEEFGLPKYTSTFQVLKWDVQNNVVLRYRYTDTTMWKALNEHYKSKQYSVISTSYDRDFVFGLFKWEKDSAGETHLIPKSADINAVEFR